MSLLEVKQINKSFADFKAVDQVSFKVESGKIYDIPWETIKVSGENSLADFEVSELQVILKGNKKRG